MTSGPRASACAAPWRRVFYGWWMVAGLAVTELVSWGVLVYTFSVFVVPMHTELGWSTAQLNGAYATGVAVSGLVAVPVGRRLARHGARGVMTAGSLFGVAALLMWAQAHSLVSFYAAFVLAGLAMATTLYEPAFAVTATWFTRHRARAVLVLTIAGGLSSTVFVPLTGLLVGAYGWRTTLVLLAVALGLITVPLHAGLLRRWPADVGAHPDGRSADTRPPAQPASTGPAITRRASFRWFTLGLVSHTTGKLAVTVILVAYLTDRGYQLSQATLAAGAVGGFQVLGRLACTALQPRVPAQRTATLLFVAQALALPAPLLSTGHTPAATVAIVTLVVFFGLGYGLPDLLRGTVLVDYYGPCDYPHINGIIAIFLVAARAAGPLLAGLGVTVSGSHSATLIGASALIAIGAYALHRVDRAFTGPSPTPCR
ncbi:MFS transporter [Pseudonocardia eucalypti]|uniref:MFS transporter n=1 Tax=Pseudonocardia eucalypti TaxID=648755 RepID=A0ABP9RAT5_9PSEU|nr:MFS family permease [Pseudonocardia eucalypti]